MEKLYYERSGGKWEAWVYSDGARYILRSLDTLAKIETYARRHGYKLIAVS